MTDADRPELSAEQQRIIERGLAGVAWFEAEHGAFTEEELEAARQRVEESLRQVEAIRSERGL